ncbi:unnamed protein product [Miscanthus lutarioriparius]|uniref:Uncharacterized protein n=1 Tax=Miscanthus lutarioriparius TaxID=422564 RepID=A0A811N3V7_9POAL|nr:unnamed protein product [Miscanthus lutarioriparius]
MVAASSCLSLLLFFEAGAPPLLPLVRTTGAMPEPEPYMAAARESLELARGMRAAARDWARRRGVRAAVRAWTGARMAA